MVYRGVMTKPKLLGYEQVAERIGVDVRAVRTYLAKARAHRASGNPRPGDLPEPDLVIGKSPAWFEATVARWERNRPGRGAGGGPKRKPRSSARNPG